MRFRLASIVAGVLALALALAQPVLAQTAKLVDFNSASEADLRQLPNLNPAIAGEIVKKRPFKSMLDLNKVLVDQKLNADQIKAVYGKAFIPINLNSGSREEFLLIPGVGPRMTAEFREYRPWKTWAQFDKEISKYVGQPETDRLKQYVFIPPG